MKRAHTSFDEPRLVENNVGLNDRSLSVTLYNLCNRPLFKVYLTKYNKEGSYDIINYEVLDPSIRVIKDDMSNHCKSYVLQKLMGVNIKNCETTYYCVENGIVVGKLNNSALSNNITLESRLSCYWNADSISERQYHTSVSQDAIFDVLLCLDMCRVNSISDIIDKFIAHRSERP